jgi:hypothetical protein
MDPTLQTIIEQLNMIKCKISTSQEDMKNEKRAYQYKEESNTQ